MWNVKDLTSMVLLTGYSHHLDLHALWEMVSKSLLKIDQYLSFREIYSRFNYPCWKPVGQGHWDLILFYECFPFRYVSWHPLSLKLEVLQVKAWAMKTWDIQRKHASSFLSQGDSELTAEISKSFWGVTCQTLFLWFFLA